jgi:hypothetical protein
MSRDLLIYLGRYWAGCVAFASNVGTAGIQASVRDGGIGNHS